MEDYRWSTRIDHARKLEDGRVIRIWDIWHKDHCPGRANNIEPSEEIKKFIIRYNKEKTILPEDVDVLDHLGHRPRNIIKNGDELPTKLA